MRTKFQTATLFLLLAAVTGCAPSVMFQQIQPGHLGAGRDLGIAVSAPDFEVNLDLAGLRELAAVRKKNSQNQGTPADTELFAPLVEREMMKNITANPVIRLSTSITHTIAVSGALYVRDITTIQKDEIKLENRVVDVRETATVDRVFELTLNYQVISAATGTTIFSGKQEGVRSQRGQGKTAQEAVERFEPWEDVLESLIAQESGKMLSKVLPRQVTVTRKLKEGSSKALRASVEVAVKEGLDRAWPLWQAIKDSGEQLAPADRSALFHNMGVYYESKDDLVNARLFFEQCLAAQDEELCRKGQERIKSREEALDTVR
ncbi:MAG: hypothetical protein OEW15_00355 [Nitrospirota bacterium]|nr:hypothetical protein [Nitrospirota bacterium]